YFLLTKETPEDKFDEMLMFNLARVQLDFYAIGAQGSLSWTELVDSRDAFSQTQLSKFTAQLTQLHRDLVSLARFGDTQRIKPKGRHAFVIMAFVDDLKDVYELGIKECLRSQFKMEAFRIDERYHRGLIIQQIYEDIHQSEVII